MLEFLLYPKSVAVMGASRTAGKVGYAVVTNLIEGGFEGDIVPVNPSGGELMGQKFYTSLEEYGKTIDMSVIAVPTAAVKEAVISSLKAKAKAVVDHHRRLQRGRRSRAPRSSARSPTSAAPPARG